VRYFSSDRAERQYAEEIRHAAQVSLLGE